MGHAYRLQRQMKWQWRQPEQSCRLQQMLMLLLWLCIHGRSLSRTLTSGQDVQTALCNGFGC